MSRLLPALGVSLLIAVGASLACLPLMALMFLMPYFVAVQRSRSSAYCVALVYYTGASWALIQGARNFFGPTPSRLDSVGLWLLSSSILASPFAMLWTSRRDQMAWRIPIATVINALPPLGIIGWASPLTSAGLLFPGTEWLGVITIAAVPGLLIVRPRMTAGIGAVMIVLSNFLFGGGPAAPSGWQAVDTDFGGIAHGGSSAVAAFLAADRIQELARSSKAHVIIFPRNGRTGVDGGYQPVLATNARRTPSERKNDRFRGRHADDPTRIEGERLPRIPERRPGCRRQF